MYEGNYDLLKREGFFSKLPKKNIPSFQKALNHKDSFDEMERICPTNHLGILISVSTPFHILSNEWQGRALWYCNWIERIDVIIKGACKMRSKECDISPDCPTPKPFRCDKFFWMRFWLFLFWWIGDAVGSIVWITECVRCWFKELISGKRLEFIYELLTFDFGWTWCGNLQLNCKHKHKKKL